MVDLVVGGCNYEFFQYVLVFDQVGMYQYLVEFYNGDCNCYCSWVKINKWDYGLERGVEYNCKGGNLKYSGEVEFFILVVYDMCCLYEVDFMVQLVKLILC